MRCGVCLACYVIRVLTSLCRRTKAIAEARDKAVKDSQEERIARKLKRIQERVEGIGRKKAGAEKCVPPSPCVIALCVCL